jgi:hypothetical protein
MPEYRLADAPRYFSNAYWLLKMFFMLHIGVFGLAVSLLLKSWMMTTLFAACLLVEIVSKSFRFLWTQAEWFRVSLSAQAIVQIVGAGFSAISGSTRGMAIAAAIGAFIALAHLSVAYNFCKTNGVPTRERFGTPFDGDQPPEG